MSHLRNIKRLYTVIYQNLFTVCGHLNYDRTTDAIIKMANLMHEYPDEADYIWYLGEGKSASINEIIVGAYWHYTEWNSGQWSKGYEALSALDRVFSPGMESCDPEDDTYFWLETMAKNDSVLAGIDNLKWID